MKAILLTLLQAKDKSAINKATTKVLKKKYPVHQTVIAT